MLPPHVPKPPFEGLLRVYPTRFKVSDIEVGLDLPPEPGLADNGDLEQDLTSLFEATGVATRQARSTIAMFIDELQYVREPELADLITALNRASQLQLPLVLVGARLPQLRGRAGKAKSSAERLFDYPEVGPLDPIDARRVIELPAPAHGDTAFTVPLFDQFMVQAMPDDDWRSA